MRIFTAAAATETNTFSPIRTGDSNFTDWFPAGQHPDRREMFSAPLAIAREQVAKRAGWTLIEGLCAGAQPAGIIRCDTWERIRDEILRDLVAAMPVDMVLMGLHGAMVAEGYPDCEGDLLARIREIVGPGVAVGGLLDPHCHLTPTMVANADILIAYKEYPHFDVFDRAQELWDLTLGTAQGTLNPSASVADCRMMTFYYTPVEPMKQFVTDLRSAEEMPGVLSASLIHGFPWGDVPHYGTKLLVYTDDDATLGETIAGEFSDRLYALRGQTMTELISIEDAVTEALGVADDVKPLVLADFSDNVGAGCPGDSTHVIGALIEAGVTDLAAAFIFDPVAVQLATAAGVGGRLPLRVGGKACSFSGKPMDLEVEVTHLASNGIHDVMVAQFDLGDVAVVKAPGDNHLVLTSKRAQCITPAAFTDFGIDLAPKRVLVPKSMQHFYIVFSRISDRIRYVDSPGVATMSLKDLPFRHIDKAIWPFLETA
jgi:microcystin degradation protein MlrC